MRKALGIGILFLLICGVTAAINPNFLQAYNAENLINWTSLYGIISIGAALVIVTGGIDLSIGSVVGLVGTLLAWLLVKQHWNPVAAVTACLLLSVAIGVFHGLLITGLKLQPFVVTLCGLMIYRGAARWLTHDDSLGFGNDYDGLRRLVTGRIELPFLPGHYRLPVSMIVVLVIGVLASVFLHKTVKGRHMLATGRNEEAARYSGIYTKRLLVLAYVLCSLLAGVGGILFALDVNSVQPAIQGNFYELYAIAAAVLGGCSLRGGEGSMAGVLIGAAVMRVLYNSINVLGFSPQLEFVIIGTVLLLGVTADELLRRWRKV